VTPDTTPSAFFDFGPFRLDPARRRLMRDGEPVKLTAKAYDVLLALIQHRTRVVEKDDLMRLVWGDTAVEESNLTQTVFVLRKILGEEPDDHRYIATIPRRGYRFVGEVHETRATGEPADVVAQTPANRSSKGGPSKAALNTLAVLPFTSLEGGAADSSLGLGMADALITRLGNVRTMTVRSTASVWRYAGVAQDPLVAGRELAVDAVLEGRVQRSESRIRVTVQLVSVGAGCSIWGDRFDEPLADIFAVQDAIAERVLRALLVRLTGEARSGLGKRDTDNVEAYQAYLKGRYHWNRRTEEGLTRAVEHFEQAIEQDKTYAHAFTGLADCHLLLGGFGFTSLRQSVALAQAAALKAVGLDQSLAEAWTSLGLASLYSWRWSEAERQFAKAIDLSPHYPTVHNWRAAYLAAVGRPGESLAASEQALAADPLNLTWNTGVGHFCYFTRQYDRAIAQEVKTLELDPTFFLAYWILALAHDQLDRASMALAAAEQAVMFSGRSAFMLGFLGRFHARSGNVREAKAVLAELERLKKRRHVSPQYLAFVHAGRGDRTEALNQLEEACRQQELPLVYYLKSAPAYDDLRADPRFADVLQRIGVADGPS
jgi:DNA-binding winged helix-turn-helix (wHTH) protein/tetratricopeptide (TPR) repeat protein